MYSKIVWNRKYNTSQEILQLKAALWALVYSIFINSLYTKYTEFYLHHTSIEGYITLFISFGIYILIRVI